MKSLLTIMISMLVIAPVWTPEPSPPPQVKEIGETTIVGNRAVFLMDREKMQAKSGADVDLKDLFPPESQVEDWQYYMEESMTAKSLPKGTTSIGRFAFARSGLKSISLPEGMTTIEYAAFYHCDDLEEVYIPATVTKIEPYAFSYTAWMKDFLCGKTYPGTDFLIVGDGILLAYRGDAERVLIPEGVKTIAAESFLNHKEIQEVVLPVSLETIEEDAFKGTDIKPAK